MKRLMKMLAAVATIGAAMLAPFGAWADTWPDDDGHVWTYEISGETATITAVTGAEYDMEIPATLGGKTVVAFGTIFYKNDKISSIVIPDGVTAIAAQAFDECSQLQHVTVGAGVQSVGNYAFRNCALLQKIELPATTTTLGTGAFAYCVKLNTAKLPGVTSIPGTTYDDAPDSYYASSRFNGFGTFFGCEKLRTIQLGNNLSYIGRGAFYNCNEIYDLTIPDSVTHIDNFAFAECDKLHDLTLGSGLTGVGYRAFYNDTQLETLVFRGTSVDYLAAGAFQNCQNLQALNLPEGLKWIGEYCFMNCDSIPSVTIPDSVTTCTNGAFAYCDGIKTVKVGAGLTHIAGTPHDDEPGSYYASSRFEGFGVFFMCKGLTSVSLNATLRSIGRGAFYGCSSLPEIVIPDNVQLIDRFAFSSCALLKNVTIGNNVRTIGRGAFSSCEVLNSVTIGNNVRLIDDRAFYNDTKLESVTFGAKVQTINENAFGNCYALRDFTLPDTVLTIGKWAFNSCRSLVNVTIPDSVGTIGAGVFAYCTGLQTVVIGNGVEEITGTPYDDAPGSYYSSSRFDGLGSFYGCTALKNVTIGSSVATIGRGAFYGCTALPSIKIPSCVTTIGQYAFAECKALNTLDIVNGGVTLIDEYAFLNDSSLVAANLGNRLVTIGACAFQYCTSLTGLTLPESLITLNGWCFAGDVALVQIVIPDKVKDLGTGAFAYCTGLKSVKIGSNVSMVSGTPYDDEPGSYYASSRFNGYGAFYGCTALTDLNLGSTVSEIGRGAFYGCSSLASVVIPNSVTKIGQYAFGACTSLIKAEFGTGLATMEDRVFDGDKALHYVEFKGDAAPANMGSDIFNGTTAHMTTYVADGSTGWTALYQPGLPETWQGRAITYAPPPANADAPYDFYLVTPTFGYYDEDAWPAPVIVTSERFEADWEVPELETTFREGDTLYLSYAYDEYWRGEAFNLTNRFTLSGAKSGTFEYVHNWDAHETADYGWKTNAVPELLQNLAPGNYTLSFQLNANNRLKETDYSNNSTSITFTVVSVPKYTVAFNLNGAPGTAPASRTIYEGKPIGELPTVTAPAGWSFLGWYTAASGGDEVEADTRVTANMTCFAQWAKCDLGFYFNPDDVDWSVPLFVTSSSDGTEPMTSFVQGTRIYLKYGFRNLAGNYDVKGFVNRFALNTGVTFDDDWTGYTLYGDDWGWGGAYWYPSALQNLAPGSYTLTCTLDATGKLSEMDEGNNTRSITFTIVSKDAQSCTVTFNANGGSVSETKRTVTSGTAVGTLPTPTRSGYTYDGWFTAASGGTKVTSSTKVTANVTFYAHWTQNGTGGGSGGGSGGSGGGYGDGDSHELYPTITGTVPTGSASLYEGILQDGSGNVSGSISVKVAKPNKDGEAKVTVTVISADGKKEILKSTLDVASGKVEGTGLKLGEDAMGGKFNGYDVDGARSVFSSKSADDKAIAAAVYGKWPTVSVAWNRGALTVTVNRKGKAKISGSLVSGVKVSAKSQVLVGDEWLCVPVMWSKKGERVVFLLWLKGTGDATYEASVEGLGDDVKVGGPRALKSGAAFTVDKAALCSMLGSSAYSAYLPNGVSVEQSGTKWIVAGGAKAGKVQLGKDGKVDGAKAGKNASGLKLRYKAKDGTFKGSFKAYADVNGKPKATTVSVTGVMVGSKGYGIATIKNKGGIPVSVE